MNVWLTPLLRRRPAPALPARFGTRWIIANTVLRSSVAALARAQQIGSPAGVVMTWSRNPQNQWECDAQQQP